MPKKYKMSDQDQLVFKTAMKGVKPIIHNKIEPTVKKTSTKIKTPQKELIDFKEENLVETVSGSERIAYKHPSISYQILNRLRKGYYNIEAELDLHGLTIEEAKLTLRYFLSDCIAQKKRVVLIIHGKGRHGKLPILKNKINHWLKNTPLILAFSSAPASCGGAVYVLLKQQIREK
ncbi:MAG: hypothetical protein A3F12_01040 [Gammaproteobacteria bacterium RIFCSPHIGHO2_12_FULL_38_14]|nr:MAG: hypothetical protein A3F12_01040 [Gammaproteobacteria bacterium RIFCSPHIGHO2_12_FULL_38_14]